ncbi:hypothetical protein LB565_18715 [Mesorhizobium sp. CA14]|uniref:glycosyltransferase family 9 protein n=1 Tax=Mesorhizobium sp. CA14 TaxID=2876642 RepID=UPI001CCBD371|nr:glycosyltransferase family 9 protein [Mesorhizobium sp. CA14]MBZ9850019.1 hypothetical protein [Mesorhizobium sp. CA14]
MRANRPSLVFLNGIGDHFINLPAIRAVANLFPRQLSIICRAGAAELFCNLPTRSVHEINWGLDQRDQVLASDYVVDLLTSCDLLISLNPWHTDAVDRMLARVNPPMSVGFFAAFSEHVQLDFEKHSAELAYDIPRALGSLDLIAQHSGPPALPNWAESAANNLFRSLPSGSRVLAIHPETLAEKMWCLDKLGVLIDAFFDCHPNYYAFVIGVSNLSLDRGRHAARVIPCNGLPFYASAALVANADLFLGVDSCMLHVADIFRVPSVGLFGPTNPFEFGFRLTEVHCHVTGDGTMSSIEVPQVLMAMECVERRASQVSSSRRVLLQEAPY